MRRKTEVTTWRADETSSARPMSRRRIGATKGTAPKFGQIPHSLREKGKSKPSQTHAQHAAHGATISLLTTRLMSRAVAPTRSIAADRHTVRRRRDHRRRHHSRRPTAE